jgi:hypothetical protein
MYFT